MTGAMPLELPNLIKNFPEGLDHVATPRNLLQNKKLISITELKVSPFIGKMLGKTNPFKISETKKKN